MVKPIKTLELHYQIIQFLMKYIINMTKFFPAWIWGTIRMNISR